MPKKAMELTALAVAKIKKPGYHAVGGVPGLYLQIVGAEARSWVLRYMLAGKSREMGLGPSDTVTLSEARAKAAEQRKLLLMGTDPLEARNAKRNAERLEAAKSILFSKCAEAYIEAHKAGWKNAKHADQWGNTLATYAFPIFGALSVASVDTGLVLKALEAIWTTKNETASRLRGRIESVLDWATVRGYRTGDNPARWKGHLDKLLAKPSNVQEVEHHPALPYAEMGAFVALLRKQEGMAARALEFLILTATRTGEVIGAQWDEFDLQTGVWAIPKERMKMKKEHRVPLSPRALEIVKATPRIEGQKYIFPGGKMGKPLSNMAMLMLLKRMERHDLTAHGFRSSFRDWCAEATNYPREVAEMALAHAIGDKVEAAYRRGDLFDKRGRLMEEWAKHCDTIMVPGDVIPINLARSVTA